MDASSKEEMQFRCQLANKLAAITAALGKFFKDGRNEKQGYSFVSYEQINAKLREMLLEHKLAMLPTFEKITEREIQTKTGFATRSVVEGKMTIFDLETGYSFTAAIVGADTDTGGKSLGKAVTEAVKRYEMKLFHISTQDDIDPDALTPDAPAGPPLPRAGYAQYPQQPQQNAGWM